MDALKLFQLNLDFSTSCIGRKDGSDILVHQIDCLDKNESSSSSDIQPGNVILSSDESKELEQFVSSYKSKFENCTGRCSILPHVINLKENVVPIKQRPYPVPPLLLPDIHREVDKLIEKNYVEPSSSS